MKKKAIIFSMAILMLAALSSFQAQAADNVQVLVWSGNGAYHVEVEFLKGNATDWGYDVTSNTEEMNASVLEGIDILIVNGPDYVKTAEIDVISTWFAAAEDRGLWVAGESDYGGYWYPQGLNATHQGVNHVILAIGGHIFIQDDAVNDAVMNDGAGYRPLPNIPNLDNAPAKHIMKGVENVSMHGPANVVAYSSWTGTGRNVTGTMDPEFDDIENCDWLIKTSTTGSVADQDFDDDVYWEGYAIGENLSIPMAAIEWDLTESKNKLVVTGESIYA
ncbi:MAG: hypothetical protein ACXACW_13145, partial [Candidatus Hodarchaeales archaeon]